MRIRVRLDVTILLKKKKKILIGKEQIVYAYFQYEKLSLFCFICGKLGHGESFCPFRTRMDPSKIVFGWDISLRAAVRRRNATVSKWLREADSRGGELAKSYPNPNFIPLGSSQMALNKEIDKWLNMVNRELYGADNGHGPMKLQLDEENDPLHALEGKKRQRVVNDLVNLSSNNSDGGVNDILASSAGQSS
ncbi:hypothetical protein Golob_010926 [Gossypium lobatum]|uniref:Zinc knuckle CX2CX4HX4C domain-containing protein n=1 Tax=Gossypium lobatum TaxID=34289 RepID=A0A7J8MN64_9ROSI|nr:hypothetical protein [Gossypium lobatum]